MTYAFRDRFPDPEDTTSIVRTIDAHKQVDIDEARRWADRLEELALPDFTGHTDLACMFDEFIGHVRATCNEIEAEGWL